MRDSCIFSQTGVIEISHLMTEVLDELCWCTANRRGWWVSEAVFLLAGNCSRSSRWINIWINHRGINLLLSSEECLLEESALYFLFLFFLFSYLCACVRVCVFSGKDYGEDISRDLVTIDSHRFWIPRTYFKRSASVKGCATWKQRKPRKQRKRRSSAQMCARVSLKAVC